jgi:ATP-binding cassette, subfamily B, bacterial PglK
MIEDEGFVPKGNSFLNAVRSIQKHTNRAHKRQIAVLSVLTFLSAIFDVVGLAAVLPLIKAGTDPAVIHSNEYLNGVYTYFGFESEKYFVLFLIGILLVLFIFKTLFGIFVNWLQARLIAKIAVYITKNQYEKYYRLDFLDFNSIRSSFKIRNILYNPTSYVQWIIHPMTMIISEMFIVLLIVGAIAYYDLFLLTFIVLTIGPATYVVYRALKKKGTRIGIGIDQVFPYTLSSLNESIQGYVDVKLSGSEERYQNRFLRHLKNYQEMMQSASLLAQIPLRTNEVVALLGIILIFLYALFISGADTDVLLLVGAFAAAAYRLMPSMNRILNSFTFINKNQVSIYNLDLYEDLMKNESGDLNSGLVSFEKSISFRQVAFSFPGASSPVIKNLDFEVKKGEKVGFVGSSGSGKTTLMNILLRFYKETSGELLVDGKPLVKAQTNHWRSLIGYVKQDIFLLDGTIRENITLGDPEYDEQRLQEAVAQASLQDLVASLPQGLDSPIGEKGANLSGGQRQRIGIARSLYRNAQILIFDEATSALDTTTENEVTEAIDSLSGINKTVFIIAHRITTLKNCDRIYELSNGEIAGIHSYRELIARVV